MTLVEVLGSVPAPAVYTLVGAFVGAESLGIPVPGETALIAGALLAAHHQHDQHSSTCRPCSSSWWGWVGAVVGDSLGYEVGARHGDRVLARLGRWFPRHASPPHVAYAAHVFERYGVVAVFAGRFVAMLRILAGRLSGTLRLRYPRFLAANALGALTWAGSVVSCVCLLGTSAERWVAQAGWAALAVVVLAVLGCSRVIDREFQRRVATFGSGGRRPPAPPPTPSTVVPPMAGGGRGDRVGLDSAERLSGRTDVPSEAG